MTGKRIVFDCNVIVSAMINGKSTSGRAFDIVLNPHHIITSEKCLEEIARVLNREKFSRYFSAEEAVIFLEVFRDAVVIVTPSEAISACRAPKDDMNLEAAVTGEADYIVTGDPDLLVLSPFRQILILPPHEFLLLSE